MTTLWPNGGRVLITRVDQGGSGEPVSNPWPHRTTVLYQLVKTVVHQTGPDHLSQSKTNCPHVVSHYRDTPTAGNTFWTPTPSPTSSHKNRTSVGGERCRCNHSVWIQTCSKNSLINGGQFEPRCSTNPNYSYLLICLTNNVLHLAPVAMPGCWAWQQRIKWYIDNWNPRGRRVAFLLTVTLWADGLHNSHAHWRTEEGRNQSRLKWNKNKGFVCFSVVTSLTNSFKKNKNMTAHYLY